MKDYKPIVRDPNAIKLSWSEFLCLWCIIAAILFSALAYVALPPGPSIIKGSLIEATDTFYVNLSNGTNSVYENQTNQTWLSVVTGGGDGVSSHFQVSYRSGDGSGEWDMNQRSLLQWDTSGRGFGDNLDNVLSVTIRCKVSEDTIGYGDGILFTLYEQLTEPSGGWLTTLAAGDYDIIGGIGTNTLCNTEDQDDYDVNDWVEFEIYDTMWEEIFFNDYDNSCVAMQSIADRSMTAPAWSSDYTDRIKFYASTYPAELVIEYYAAPPEMVVEVDPNDDVDPDTDGSEVSDNITWISPRCGFSNETIAFEVHGDSGAPVDLSLVTSGGQVLDTIDDSVRVDSDYRASFNVNTAFQGFVRCVDSYSNIESEWGYISRRVNTQEIGYVYAELTDYPQYEEPFSTYCHHDGDIMIVHWKTGLDPSDYPDESLRCWYLGDSGNEEYNETFDDLVDDYFKITDQDVGDNDDLAAWRFALFAFNDSPAGFNDFDEIINVLDIDYSITTSGFYQFLLYEDGVGEDTTTHSAEWFIEDPVTDGLLFNVVGADPGSSGEIDVSIYAGDYSNVLYYLHEYTVNVYNYNDQVIDTASGTLSLNDTIINVSAPAVGSGIIEIILTDSTISYSYIYHIPIQVTYDDDGGSITDMGEGFWAMFTDTIDNIGLDNPGGHWLIILILMILVALMVWKDKLLRIILPLGVLAFGLVTSFLDLWIVILLAIVAGGIVFGIIRKRLAGGG